MGSPPDRNAILKAHLKSSPISRGREASYCDSPDNALAYALDLAPSIAAERDVAPLLLAKLLDLPESERPTAVASEPRFQTYSLASFALEKCHEAVSRDLGLAFTTARLARLITRRIDPQTCGGVDALADLGAYAFAMEANAQRVCGHWPSAIVLFGRARDIQKQRGTDPDLMARVLLMESSLRRDLRQFEESLSLLESAAEVFVALDDGERFLTSQINRANLYLVQGKFDGAGTILQDSLDKTSDPQLSLIIRHNLALTLTIAGRAREAANLIEETRDLYLLFSDPLITNRRLWVEGVIAQGLGQNQRARRLLQEASDDLDEHGYAFDAALARIDLAKIRAHDRGEPPYTC